MSGGMKRDVDRGTKTLNSRPETSIAGEGSEAVLGRGSDPLSTC